MKHLMEISNNFKAIAGTIVDFFEMLQHVQTIFYIMLIVSPWVTVPLQKNKQVYTLSFTIR